jgi:phenylalanyl-tRNA synthetase beta chain
VRRAPHEPDRRVAVADLVSVLEAIAEELRIVDWGLIAASDAPGLHPARSAEVTVEGRRVGVIGEISALVVDALDLPTPTVAFELDVDALRAATRAPRRYAVVSRFPASTIDLAFVVDDTVPAGAVLGTLRDASGELGERVELFDVFRSEAIGEGRVSLAFAIAFRAPDRTLTDDEVAQLRRALIDAVTQAHDAELRG